MNFPHSLTIAVLTWYFSPGHTMANGKPYVSTALTVAANRYPLGTKLQLSANHHSTIVTVTDRTARRYSSRIDGTPAVWRALDLDQRLGNLPVSVQPISSPRDAEARKSVKHRN